MASDRTTTAASAILGDSRRRQGQKLCREKCVEIGSVSAVHNQSLNRECSHTVNIQSGCQRRAAKHLSLFAVARSRDTSERTITRTKAGLSENESHGA